MALSPSMRSASRRRNWVVSPSAGLLMGKSDGTVMGGDGGEEIFGGAGTETFFFRFIALGLR